MGRRQVKMALKSFLLALAICVAIGITAELVLWVGTLWPWTPAKAMGILGFAVAWSFSYMILDMKR